MLEQVIKFFVVFFVVVEPVSLAPVFAGLTEGASDAYKRKMSLKAALVAAGILLLFALTGAAFLRIMGISIDAFRIFGGLLLFLMALEMVFARESGTRTSSDEQAESKRRADISVFPLAFPLLAGMIGTGDPKVAFKDADYALLVGARPRGPGMERKDLLMENAKIFIEQGKAINEVASRK